MSRISIDIKRGEISKQDSDLVVGIDLGTTHSLISYMHDGKPEVIQVDGTTALVPSIVHIDANDTVSIGHDAKSQLSIDPEHTIFSVKRLMGKSLEDLQAWQDRLSYPLSQQEDDALIRVQVNNRYYSPIELSAFILRALKQKAETMLDQQIGRAVITVPAYFNDSQRQATRDAGKLAGLDVLRIVNEPTAACLAYGLEQGASQRKLVAVYDLGGGTFDISILAVEDGIFEVLATHGDTFLGGDDIDAAIYDYWVKRYNIKDLDTKAQQQLRLAAEQAKIDLNTQTTVKLNWNDQLLELDRSKFEEIVKPILDKTLDSCALAIKDAGLITSQLDELILAGGSTRSKTVQTVVAAFFGRSPRHDINPDEVVALGAAVQADILAGNRKDMLLLDVTPLSLGIETVGGLMDVIIPRNTKIPYAAARNYTTSVDGQSKLKVSVFQGERDLVTDNRALGSFTLENIPPMPAGIPKIEIRFMLDANGILRVQASELRSGVEQTIRIKSQYGISEEEMAKMLLDSIQHAQEDMDRRAYIESKTEGEQLLLSTSKFINQNKSWLSAGQISELNAKSKNLQESIARANKEEVDQAMIELNEYSQPLAHQAMEHHISANLSGKKIDET